MNHDNEAQSLATSIIYLISNKVKSIDLVFVDCFCIDRLSYFLSIMKISLCLFALPQALAFTVPDHIHGVSRRMAPKAAATVMDATKTSTDNNNNSEEAPSSSSSSQRRLLLASIPAITAAMMTSTQFAAPSFALTTSADGNLPDLPNEAVRSYLQYRVALQIAADYYIFDMQGMLADIDQWGEIGQLFRVNNNKGQGSPSRIERDYVNPMRVLLLSMPPDVSDDMRDAQFRFEKAMSRISKATSGYRRDLPVEVPASTVTLAKAGWEEGRVALNEFFVLLNGATGLDELKAIPAAGPKQRDEYGRSYRKYNELVKKTKLCQNRGGPALSQAWGGLMVSGYMQDSCGIPDLDLYFYQ
jgi:hypothetical protein